MSAARALGFACAALLALTSCRPSGGGGSAGKVPPGTEAKWLGNFDEAVKAAKAANKPILVDFGADW